jgi:hypothetical protein
MQVTLNATFAEVLLQKLARPPDKQKSCLAPRRIGIETEKIKKWAIAGGNGPSEQEVTS